MWRHEAVSNRIAGPELILRKPALGLLHMGECGHGFAPDALADRGARGRVIRKCRITQDQASGASIR